MTVMSVGGTLESKLGADRPSINPITVEVVRNAVNAYADEMATALCKSAYNMMIYEVRDFCCGLIDTQARMISQNRGGLPIFLADLGIAVKDGIDRYGLDGFAPGDVIIMNHGLVCGQHLNNVVIYRALGGYRRHAARFRLKRHHGDLRRRFAAPLAQDLRGGKTQ